MTQKETDNEITDQILSIMMNFSVILDVIQIFMKDSPKQSQRTLLWQLSVAIPTPDSYFAFNSLRNLEFLTIRKVSDWLQHFVNRSFP